MSEQAVGDDTPTPTTPTSTVSPFGDPEGPPVAATLPPKVSIVDTILNLDELMSADVRRAEKTARFFLEAWREARIDELEAELQQLTDAQGNPVQRPDRAVSETGEDGEPVRTAYDVAVELQTEQALLARSARSVRMRQVADDDWMAFEAKWKDAIAGAPPRPVEFWNELIAMSAHTPQIPIAKVRAMRKQLGHPPMEVLGMAAWDVNATSGVSVPKSRLSSHVLKLGAQTLS